MTDEPTVTEEQVVSLTLDQVEDYAFRVRFDDSDIPDLDTDEPPPLGGDAGPNPSRLLGAAIANCLASSLLFALRKFRDEPGHLSARVRVTLARNAQRRWRVGHVGVQLDAGQPAAAMPHLERALAQFEDFCVVTESVRHGFPVDVVVRDGEGRQVHPAA